MTNLAEKATTASASSLSRGLGRPPLAGGNFTRTSSSKKASVGIRPQDSVSSIGSIGPFGLRPQDLFNSTTGSAFASGKRGRSQARDVGNVTCIPSLPTLTGTSPNGPASRQLRRSSSLPNLRNVPNPPFPTPDLRLLSYVEVCRNHSLLPKYARPARDGLRDDELDICGLGLGDAQLAALICDDQLVPAEQIRRWRVRDGRLTGYAVSALAEVLTPETELIDLAVNELGTRGFHALPELMMRDGLPQLQTLDLSKAGLRNDSVASLCAGLAKCPMLMRLDLNSNSISDGSALGWLLDGHTHIMRLSLHLNQMSGPAGVALFKGVLRNARAGGRLADVDVAWNNLGEGPGAPACAQAISAVLKERSALFHLDLSYNNFDSDCCGAIGEGLRDNHQLYGLHLVGNAAQIDADGFLCPLSEKLLGSFEPASEAVDASFRSGAPDAKELEFGTMRVEGSCSLLGRRRGTNGGFRSDSPTKTPSAASPSRRSGDNVFRERDVLEKQTSCWACEGWERVEVTWTVAEGAPEPTAVWVFTSLDSFRSGIRLQKVGPTSFSVARMVPRGHRLNAVFQVDSSLRTSPYYPELTYDEPVEVELLACPELPELNPPLDQDVARRWQCITKVKGKNGGEFVENKIALRTRSVNVFPSHGNAAPSLLEGPVGTRTVLLDGPDGIPVQMPRVTETEFRRVTKRRTRPFYTGYQRDTQAVANECLAMDLTRAKVGRIIGDAYRPRMERLLHDRYLSFLQVYKVLSSDGMTSDCGFGISQIGVSDAMVASGMMDGETTKLADIDRFFIASKVAPHDQKKGQVVRVDKAVVRHQFLEFLLRLADQRFVQTGRCEDIVEATKTVLDAVVALGCRQVDGDDFINEFHREDVDDIVKQNMPALQVLYRQFSGALTPPGVAAFMCVDEFQSCLEAMNAYDTDFPQRRFAVAFRMGMMTQADECFSRRFQEMSFLEFLHALGAMVYLKDGYAPGSMAVNLREFFARNLTKHGARKRTARA